jgi:cellulose synthase/poly-beta-1,6-N-acetylglucosamine synthase-like glycosyltransferase
MKKITLYIPCYNAARFLDRIFPAVMNQSHPIEEILIIDDGSKDDTLNVARRLSNQSKYPTRIIALSANKGLAHARNVGFTEAKTEFVASLDADCIPEPDWLEKLMHNFSNEKIAGVCGKLIETALYRPADRWRSTHMYQHWGNKKITNPRFLFGHSNVFRKSAVIKAGLYDERHKTNAEDIQISLALNNLGYNLVYDPSAITKHLKTDTLSSILNAEFRYSLWKSQKGWADASKRIIWHLVNFMIHLKNDITAKRLATIHISLIYPFWMIFCELKHRIKAK